MLFLKIELELPLASIVGNQAQRLEPGSVGVCWNGNANVNEVAFGGQIDLRVLPILSGRPIERDRLTAREVFVRLQSPTHGALSTVHGLGSQLQTDGAGQVEFVERDETDLFDFGVMSNHEGTVLHF